MTMNTERKSRRQFGGAILRIYKWMGWVGFLQALWQIQSKSQGLTMITKKIKTSIWRTCLELEFFLFPCCPVCKFIQRVQLTIACYTTLQAFDAGQREGSESKNKSKQSLKLLLKG